ncbi:MAG: COQ9 family protein [Pseudomonadota bacterium]
MSVADEPQFSSDEETRRFILAEVLAEAAFEGFTSQSLKAAAKASGVETSALDAGLLARLFPAGAVDVISYWSSEEDQAMALAFDEMNPKPHGVTKKITWLIKQRIEGLDWNREAARRAAATLALPHNAARGAQLVWATADMMWRTIGDSSTDFNWYTKRASLSAIYTATLSRWFADTGAVAEEPYKDTWAFLDARIENLMQFEKAKAQLQKNMPDISSVAQFLGRLRYGSDKPPAE